jgi:hypothetical protein
MRKSDIEELIVAGVISKAFGKVIAKRSSNRTEAEALATAALLASIEAQKKARSNNIPLIYEQANRIYEELPNGRKKVIKKLSETRAKKLPKQFKLD